MPRKNVCQPVVPEVPRHLAELSRCGVGKHINEDFPADDFFHLKQVFKGAPVHDLSEEFVRMLQHLLRTLPPDISDHGLKLFELGGRQPEIRLL